MYCASPRSGRGHCSAATCLNTSSSPIGWRTIASICWRSEGSSLSRCPLATPIIAIRSRQCIGLAPQSSATSSPVPVCWTGRYWGWESRTATRYGNGHGSCCAMCRAFRCRSCRSESGSAQWRGSIGSPPNIASPARCSRRFRQALTRDHRRPSPAIVTRWRRLARSFQMDEMGFSELAGWVTEAGLTGRTETELMAGFCRRLTEAGIPLARAIVILDTLHPVYEGRAIRWRADMPEAVEAIDYGRTSEGEAAESWRLSPFFHLLQSGG